MLSQAPVRKPDFAVEASVPDHIIFGRSEMMQGVRKTVERLAGMRVPVVIEGQSGTGKEVIARKIHQASQYFARPFVKVSCPAIPAGLIESEIFGYEKGAFTGAWQSKPGRVELAHEGTLFLDEISEMELSLQAKLLHLLQDGQFSRIGSQADRKVDVLLLCATNRKLEEEVERGNFRADLYYRINVVNIRLPRLRDRREDIPEIVEYFFEVYSRQFERRPHFFPAEVLHVLCEHDWPGNIRELENYVKRYVILAGEEPFLEETLSTMELSRSTLQCRNEGLSLGAYTKQVSKQAERDRILKVLQEHHWNRRRTAEALQISYRSLLYKIKEANLPRIRRRNSTKSRLMDGTNGSGVNGNGSGVHEPVDALNGNHKV